MTEPAQKPVAGARQATASAVAPATLLRYRVMAFITGAMLILVFLGMLRYTPLIERTPSMDEALGILSQIHGFVYVVYLVTVMQVWLQAKWGYGRLATMFFGGIVPLLSFFVEKRVTREVQSAQEA